MRFSSKLGMMALVFAALCSRAAEANLSPTGTLIPGELLSASLAGPMRDVESIVFAVRGIGGDGHWYANFGYRVDSTNNMQYGPAGGRLCRLNLRSGHTTVLLDDPGGGVRDPQMHYDGGKMVFSCRRGGSNAYHLYEINTDGSGLRQLTEEELSGSYRDIRLR